MNCNRLDDFRSKGNIADVSLPEAEREHLENCQSCRELQALWESSDPTVADIPVPPQTEITQRILTGLRPVSPLPSDIALVTSFLSLAAIGVIAGVWWLGIAGWHALAPWQAGIIFSLLGGSMLLATHVLTRQMMPGARQLISPRTAIAGVFLSLLAVVLFTVSDKVDPDFVSKGLKCWSLGLTIAAAAAILFSLLLRRAAWLSPIRLGTVTGFLAGLAGLVVLEIYCPFLDRQHIALSHLGVVLTSTFIGGAIAGTSVIMQDRERAKTL